MSEKTTKFARWGDSDQMIPASYNEHLNLKLKYFSQMKKVLTAAILAVTTCAFVGCTKNEVRSISDNPQAVRFLPLNGKHSTKVMVNGTTYPTDLPFGTLAYYLPSGKNWNDNKADATLYIPKSEVVHNNGSWEVKGKTYYWPKSGSLTFFAYSPFAHEDGTLLAVDKVYNTTHDDGIHILNYDVHAHQATDFMVADIAMDKTANESNGGYTGVPIVFRHKLSQIVGINFQTVITNTTGTGPALVVHDYSNGRSTHGPLQAGDVVFKLKKVEVQNLYTEGDYVYSGTSAGSVANEGWANQVPESKEKYLWFNKTPEAFADNTTFNLTYNTQDATRNDYLLILPQPLKTSAPTTPTPATTDPLIHIEYQVLTYSDATNHSTEDVIEDVYLYNIHNSASAIDMNKKITYNFKINLEDRKIYWAPSVADWDDVTYDNIEIK